MKKLYCEEKILYPANEDINREWLTLATMEERAKEFLKEEDYKFWIKYCHNTIREMYGLPNKIFTFAITEETKASIIIFPKEPNGDRYEANIDEETGHPYILIEE